MGPKVEDKLCPVQIWWKYPNFIPIFDFPGWGPKLKIICVSFKPCRSSQVSAPLFFSWAKKWRSNMFSSNLVDKIPVSVPLKKSNILVTQSWRINILPNFAEKESKLSPTEFFLSVGRKLKLHYFPGTFLRFGSFLKGALDCFPEVMKGVRRGQLEKMFQIHEGIARHEV